MIGDIERPLLSRSVVAATIGAAVNPTSDPASPVLALLRHNKLADGLPLSGEDRSCSGHHRKTAFDPKLPSTPFTIVVALYNRPSGMNALTLRAGLCLRTNGISSRPR